jgi:hypothetical protein
MIGDQADVLNRLKSVLPPWFGTNTPVLDAALSGFAYVASGVYSLVQYAILQARIKTATDGWLDLIARDFFALTFQRRALEPDPAYRARIVAEIVRPRVTRIAVSNAVADLTGIAPVIFEPARCMDTGTFGSTPPTFVFGTILPPAPGLTSDSIIITVDSSVIKCDAGAHSTGFAGLGAWGSLHYPDQFFIKAFRPPGEGIPNVAGFGSYANPTAGGGYSFESGFMELVTFSSVVGPVTDADIYSTIARNIAAGITAWTHIGPFSGLTPANLAAEWQPVYPDRVEGPPPDTGQSIAFTEATF